MKHLAALLLLALLVGCNGSEQTPEPKAPPETPAADPVTSSSETPDPAEEDPLYVGKRIYQLKDLDKAELKVNGKTIHVWLMDDPGKRREGMMWLEEKHVKHNEGMLFVFPVVQEAGNGFWMQNTILPLDIGYIAKDGKLVDAAKGKPKDETSLPSKASFFYVLEMKQGQFQKLGIKPGTKISIPSDLKTDQ